MLNKLLPYRVENVISQKTCYNWRTTWIREREWKVTILFAAVIISLSLLAPSQVNCYLWWGTYIQTYDAEGAGQFPVSPSTYYIGIMIIIIMWEHNNDAKGTSSMKTSRVTGGAGKQRPTVYITWTSEQAIYLWTYHGCKRDSTCVLLF